MFRAKEKNSPVKKEILGIENPSKISTPQTVFLFQILNIGELYIFKNCKGSISTIIKKILNEHFYMSQSGVLDTFTQVKEEEKRERRKKEKEEKRLLRDIFV